MDYFIVNIYNAKVAAGLNPRGVFYLAGFVEGGPGGEPGFEGVIALGVEVKTGVVGEVGFVQGQVEAILADHGKGAAYGVEGVDGHGAVEAFVGFGIVGDRPALVIVGKYKFGEFVHNNEVAQVFLFRKFVAEADAVVEKAKVEVEVAFWRSGFFDQEAHFFVGLIHAALFAPKLLPAAAVTAVVDLFNAQVVFEGALILQFEAKQGGQEDVPSVFLHGVVQLAVDDLDGGADAFVGRLCLMFVGLLAARNL